MVIPYLSFQGNCEEALHFYASVFGGKVEYLSRYTKETGSPPLVGKVMHAQVSIGKGAIAGADHEGPVRHDESIKLMVHCASASEAQTYFDALAESGHAIHRLTPHPPPDDGGMGALVRDKYGYAWILTAPNDRKA